MKVIVVLNRGSGTVLATDDPAAAVRAAFEAAGVEAETRLVEGDDLERTLTAALEAPADAVVIGGGDGTVSVAARLAIARDRPIAVLPLGTFNHFAKDLGMPLPLDEAARAIAGGELRRVDVAEVNGHVFVNNSSIGVYPAAVREREKRRPGSGPGRIWAMVRAAWRVFWRLPRVHVRLHVGQEVVERKTPFVLVGNNAYSAVPLAPFSRAALDRGELAVYVPKPTGRLGMLKLAFMALIGRLESASNLDVLTTAEAWIDVRARRFHLALDGEVIRVRGPLHYRLHAGALQVLAPLRAETAPPDDCPAADEAAAPPADAAA